MELGMRIRQLRKLAGLTQEQMADKLDVSRQTVSKWESDTSIPDWESMVKISVLFHVSLDDFSAVNISENTEGITIKDLIEWEAYHRKRQMILFFAVVFFAIGIISVIIISIVNSSLLSTQYMLYRYIAVGEYTFSAADYFYSYLLAVVSGVIGLVFGIIYLYLVKSKNIL